MRAELKQGQIPHERFDFLGYTFRPRSALNNGRGELFVSFAPAISDEAAKRIRQTIRRWRIHLWSGTPLAEIARQLNVVVRGWINYYGRFNPTELAKSLRRIDSYLVRWAVSKYKRLKRSHKRARRLMVNVYTREPGLFAHWRLTAARDGMVGAG